MITGLISWIVFGLIAGYIAKTVSNNPNLGTLKTIGLGIAGSIVGGLITSLVGLGGGGFIWSMLTAVGGASLLLFGYERMESKKLR